MTVPKIGSLVCFSEQFLNRIDMKVNCFEYSKTGVILRTSISKNAIGVIVKRLCFTMSEFDLYVILFEEKLVEIPIRAVCLVSAA